MEKILVEEKQFDGVDFTSTALVPGNYEYCSFNSCNFSGINLSGFNFLECSFSDCNLGMAKLGNTGLREVKFTGCKLLGLHFEHCNAIGLSFYFDNCTLNLSSFFQLKLKNTVFKNSLLHEADFAEADLTNAVFDNCDLNMASFDHTILEKTNFSTAYNYSIDPERNRIKKATFSLAGIAGLLSKYDIEIN